MAHRRYYWSLAAIFLAAFCIRVALVIAFVGFASPPDADAQPDQLDYELYAYRISEGLGYTSENGQPTASRMPGTSLAILPVYYVLGRSFAAARISFCILSAFTCLAAAWVGTQSFGRETGLVAALLLAVYPNHAYYALHLVSEVPFAFLVVLAVGVTVRAMRHDASLWVSSGAGTLWGFSALVRPNILLLLPMLWLVATFAKETPRIQLRRALIISVVAAAVLVPWAARNRFAMGKIMLSSVGAYTFWGAHNHKTLEHAPGGWIKSSDLVDENHPLKGGEVDRMSQARKYSFEFLRDNRRSLPYLFAMKIYRLVSPSEETPNRIVFWAFATAWTIAFPLVIAGVILALRDQRWECHLLLLPLWAIIATTLIFYGCIRFRDSVASVYLIFAAVGILWVARKGREALSQKVGCGPRSPSFLNGLRWRATPPCE